MITKKRTANNENIKCTISWKKLMDFTVSKKEKKIP